MGKEESSYIRLLLTNKLKYFTYNTNINLYLKKDKSFNFTLSIKNFEIRAIFTKPTIEYFNRINYEEVKSYLESETIKNYRNYSDQFTKAYNYIKQSLQFNKNSGIGLQPICIVFGANNLNGNTLTYDAYRNFYFETSELSRLSTTFEKKLKKKIIKRFINIEELGDIMIEKWENIIFFGPPGTGKSTEIKNSANYLLQTNEDRIFRITFHPEYSYYDFVGQYKPVVGYETISNEVKLISQESSAHEKPFVYYEFIPGPFTLSVIKALELKLSGSNENVLLVIEEINRGNCAAIFGDIFQLLDRDDNGESIYGIQIQTDMKNYIIKRLELSQENWNNLYKEEFKLPSNLFLYASMNTSDESIYPIDSAFKRRWNMVYVPIDYKCKELENSYLPPPLDHIQWLVFIKTINQEILNELRSEDKQLGQWFIKKDAYNQEIFINKVLSYLWFNVLDRNHGSIFNEDINSFQLLVTKASEGIDKVFSKNIIENINKNQELKLHNQVFTNE